MTLEDLNGAPRAAAFAAFERCCGARAWVERMCDARPFADHAALLAAAGRSAAALAQADWLEAFAQHPHIGDRAALRERFASTAAWAGEEQSGTGRASDGTLDALAVGDRAYEEKFGYIFVVCATGKSAAEMLALLEARLGNEPGEELRVAAGEQMKIARLRLEKLLEDS